MNSERLESGRSPFRGDFNAQRFFTGAGRGDLLTKLLAAVDESVTFMTLTGDEGCGKTTLCRMLEKSLPDKFIPIYFPDALRSFEDLPRGIARAMQIGMAEAAAAGDIRELLLEVWERLKEKDQRILLLFDQTEKIKPEIVERIRKMLDILNNTGIAFQTFFAGRKGLRESLTPLSACSFEGAKERHFLLPPFDASETVAYLNFCITTDGSEGMPPVTPEMSEKIFKYAEGNIRMTNTLAEQSIKLMNNDTSFMVLLDNVKENAPSGPARRRRRASSRHENFLTSKRFLVPAGSCFLMLVLILMIMRITGTSDSGKGGQSASTVQSTAGSNAAPVASEGTGNEPAKGEKLPDGDEGKPAVEVEAESQPAVDNHPRLVEVAPEAQAEQQNAAVLKPEPAVQNKPGEGRPPVTEKKETVQKKQAVLKAKPVPSVPKAVAKVPVHTKEPVKAKVATVKKVPAEKLFDSRVAASARWLIGEKKDHFTIQLMALASAGSENSMKKMLVQTQYQDIAGRLYILRKVGTPPMILMFYGEYKTMAEANNAKNSLPPFLLKNNPYPVSVKAAVMKAAGK